MAEGVECHQKRMREHLIECLIRKHFTPFSKRTVLPDLIIDYVKPIYHMPEMYDDRMNCCDGCNEWFHVWICNTQRIQQVGSVLIACETTAFFVVSKPAFSIFCHFSLASFHIVSLSLFVVFPLNLFPP